LDFVGLVTKVVQHQESPFVTSEDSCGGELKVTWASLERKI